MGRGRPTKFHSYFKAMKEVYSDIASVVLTREEAHALINSKLAPGQQVSMTAVSNWRGHGPKSVENIDSVTEEEAQEFRSFELVVRAKQKLELTRDSLDNDNKGAYKQHWLLERKFDDLRQNQNAISITPTIKIEAGNAEGKKLIDQIVNGDTEEAEFEMID